MKIPMNEILTIPPSCEENDTHKETSNVSDPNGIDPGNVFCIDNPKVVQLSVEYVKEKF